jgi:hypothetical protein
MLREQYRRQGGGNENSENERFQATAAPFGQIQFCFHLRRHPLFPA